MKKLSKLTDGLCCSDPTTVAAFVARSGQPPFRAKQILEWVFKKLTLDPDAMLNLPKSLRERMKTELTCCSSQVETAGNAADCAAGGATKLLIRLNDGEAVEMVLIPAPGRMTFCLSTQVGCPVRCRFCASGMDGLVRNLQAHEIVEQFFHGVERHGGLPDNLVFMGIGEGLLNFDNLARALEIITAPEYIGMSPRRLTVSTSGYVPGIRQLAELEKPLTLAVSLHAVNDVVRAKLIPDQLRFPLAEILAASDYYQEKIGRMVTFEYTLLANINDRTDDAEKLAQLAIKHHAKINLIPYNETAAAFKRPPDNIISRFRDILEKNGANVTLRMEKGAGQAAACGQLRASR